MIWVLFSLVVILAVSLVLVLVSDLWLELHITGPFQVDIRLGFCWHWFKHKLSVPLYRYRPGASLSPKEIVDSNSTKLISLIRFAQLIKIFLCSLLPHSHIHIRGHAIVGTGDAAETGYLIGIMWHVLGLVNAFTQLLVSVSTINLTIRPEFSAICLDTDISCIVYLPVLHIISAAVKTVKHCNKTDFQQGGRKVWQNIPFRA